MLSKDSSIVHAAFDCQTIDTFRKASRLVSNSRDFEFGSRKYSPRGFILENLKIDTQDNEEEK
ncbi:hypothetical protein BpHYR1_001930 [Brachionus plicatilis]|uniref:Uncharacterized protein n=1 Tax=Brachionus plicatilis TaxID=10195 RepID=A0A3M7RRE9_BRAPC|nr:hypothetical protein BpHYR1_001930 [Brachionus plicatilis]